MSLKETSEDPTVPALEGAAAVGGDGVVGTGRRGVVGRSEDYQGVYGWSRGNAGVVAESQDFHALFAISHGANNGAVFGANNTSGAGVIGQSTGGGDGVVGTGRRGVVGRSEDYQGVYGWSRGNAGVVAESQDFHALFAVSHGANNGAIFGVNQGGGWAGVFEGRVLVTGDIDVRGDVRLAGADLAEEFDVDEDAAVAPGDVVRVGHRGAVSRADRPYDTAVLGVVSGAPGLRPALVLDRRGHGSRVPVALVGKVMCRVDASIGPIRCGDLLTTSPLPGHAMRVTDRRRAMGAVVGKALDGLPAGRGLVPILAMLR